VSVLPRFVTHNASLKIASLVAAVFLWAIAPADRTQQESLTSVPVRVQVADLAWTIAEPPFPATVEVRVAGPAREIIQLAREGATVRVPVDAVAGSDTTVMLRRDWVTLGGTSGLVVEEILPASVQLSFEPVDSAVLVVTLTTSGELPPDVALVAPIQVTPSVVRARGPARILQAMDSLPTLPFDLGSVGASRVQPVAIDTAGLGSTLFDPREVQVAVRVDAATTRELAAVPVRLVGPGAAQYRVEPDSLPIVLVGAELRFQGADLSTVGYEIDTRDIGLLEVGERRRVLATPAGLPELIRATQMSDSVTVVRPEALDAGTR
jgi:YbbR domain-containing protein